jgi:iron(III) transport system ATP-binding protein
VSELVAQGLRKSYGETEVLRGLDLRVPDGRLAAVLGPSGCGKTTLLRIIAGFEPAEGGVIRIGDVRVSAGRSVPPEKRRVGYVAQEGALFPHLTVAANVGFGLSRVARRSGRVGEMLELIGLEGMGARMPHELSGGQQQRVALARALAPEPALVLLDEPFSSLDAGLRATLRAEVRAALAKSGTTALLVTHDQEEALSTADLVAVMRGGRLAQMAAPAAIYRTPADAETAAFLGDAVLLPGDIKGEFAACALGKVPVRGCPFLADGRCTLMIRPEQIVMDERGMPARVLEVTYYGHDADVRLALTEGPEVCARTLGLTVPLVGKETGVRVEGEVVAYPVEVVKGAGKE